MMRPYGFLLALVVGLVSCDAVAADRFFGFNETTATVFTEVYLASEGTDAWGPNEALNDKDKVWDTGERLPITGVTRGRFELKIVDRGGRVCIKHGLDLTQDLTFDVRDTDLVNCGK
jgi:hypothetical protein